VFQIVHCVLDDKKEVLARRPLEPLFELWEDAAAMVEFDSSRLWDEYGYDEERSCWWSRDSRDVKCHAMCAAEPPSTKSPGTFPGALSSEQCC
jgi:hypothetical protein